MDVTVHLSRTIRGDYTAGLKPPSKFQLHISGKIKNKLEDYYLRYGQPPLIRLLFEAKEKMIYLVDIEQTRKNQSGVEKSNIKSHRLHSLEIYSADSIDFTLSPFASVTLIPNFMNHDKHFACWGAVIRKSKLYISNIAKIGCIVPDSNRFPDHESNVGLTKFSQKSA